MILPLLIYLPPRIDVTLQQQTAQISRGVWGPKDIKKTGIRSSHTICLHLLELFPAAAPLSKNYLS